MNGRARLPVVFGALVVVIAIAVVWLAQLHNDRIVWIRHTLEVETSLSDVSSAVFQAEAVQRGYILSGQETFAAAYERGRKRLNDRLNDLQKLVADNPGETLAAKNLKLAVQRKYAEMESSIALRRSGQTAAAAAAIREGSALTFKVTSVIADMRQAEEKLLAQRSQEAELINIALLAAVGATGLLVMVFSYLWVGQERKTGRALESAYDALSETNTELVSEMASRAAALTGRLLAFSRQQPLAPEPVEPNRLVTGMSDLLARTLGETVLVETVLGAGLWRTQSDAAQLESALVNLAVNARDAMPDGGKLTIETANTALDSDYAREAGVAPGQYVMLAVTDTGTGMSQEVADKAVEPFFTTKPVGKGTGLGLSQVYGFVKQSGGHLRIYSEPGQGTAVKIYLPRLFGPEGEPEAASVRTKAVPHNELQHTVLLVEDDERVRQFALEALRELGYRVIEADGAARALPRLQDELQIDLLLTDIVMPEVNGRQLAEQAVRIRPNLPVLYMTGFTRNAVVHNGMLDPGVNFLPKPFTIDQLAVKVREAIQGAKQA